MATGSRFSRHILALSQQEKNANLALEQPIFEKLFTKKQICQNLEISIAFLDKLMAANEIPYLKIGKSVRFQQSNVLAWLQKRSKP